MSSETIRPPENAAALAHHMNTSSPSGRAAAAPRPPEAAGASGPSGVATAWTLSSCGEKHGAPSSVSTCCLIAADHSLAGGQYRVESTQSGWPRVNAPR